VALNSKDRRHSAQIEKGNKSTEAKLDGGTGSSLNRMPMAVLELRMGDTLISWPTIPFLQK